MYAITDKESAVKEIQTYLLNILDGSVVTPSGIYDAATENSVIAFQKSKGIPATGAVDYRTHTLLYREYLQRAYSSKIAEGTKSLIAFPISEGDFGDHIYHINTLLSDILEHYGTGTYPRKSRYYSKDTVKAVKRMREIFMLDIGEHIDLLLYGRMLEEHKSLSDLSKK